MATKEKTQELTFPPPGEDDGKRILVDEGAYLTIVSKSESGVAKSGNKKWLVEVAVKGGKFSGEKLEKHIPTEGKGIGIARKCLLAFHDEADLVGGFKLTPDNYIGEKVIVYVEHRPFKYTTKDGTEIDLVGADVTAMASATDPAAIDDVRRTAESEGSEPASGTDEAPPF